MIEATATRSPAGTTTGLADRLASAGPAALVVAPFESRLVAANPAGARLLGISEVPTSGERLTDAGIALDSAMPAIVQLRRMAGQGSSHVDDTPPLTIHTLVFWTPLGVTSLLCRIRPMPRAEEGDRPLVLVEPMNGGGESVPPEPPLRADRAVQPDSGTPVAGVAAVDTGVTPPVALACSAAEPDTSEDEAAVDAEAQDEMPDAARAVTGSARTATRRGEQAPPRSDSDILRAIARQILAPDTPAPVAAANATGGGSEDRGSFGSGDGGGGSSDDGRPKRNAARSRSQAEAGGERPAVEAKPAPIRATDHGTALDAALDTSPDPGTGTQANAAAPLEASPRTSVANSDTPGSVHSPAPSLDAAPGAMTRRLAHELKSPLSAIAAASEIMRDERFGPLGDERYRRYARDIHDSARHAIDVIERMLGGRSDMTVDPLAVPEQAFTNVDVNTLVEALYSSMEPLARDAGVTLAVDLARGLPRIVADGTSLRQMVLNLVANSLKFSPRGSCVTIATRAEVDGPLSVSVADRGPGMSATEIARVLDDASSAEIAPRRGGGFGIGLPLVRSLAIANGADLALSNRPAGGLLAEISFPKSRQVLV